MKRLIECRTVCPGSASGSLALLDAPLSFWGGYDVDEGVVKDATHPQYRKPLKGRIVALPSGRGSSSSSSALLEAVRLGTAPAAIILAEVEPILALGALVADELYGVRIPIVICPADSWSSLREDAKVDLDAAGGLAILKVASP